MNKNFKIMPFLFLIVSCTTLQNQDKMVKEEKKINKNEKKENNTIVIKENIIPKNEISNIDNTILKDKEILNKNNVLENNNQLDLGDNVFDELIIDNNKNKKIFSSNDATINVYEIITTIRNNATSKEKEFLKKLWIDKEEYKELNIEKSSVIQDGTMHVFHVLDAIFDQNDNYYFSQYDLLNGAKKYKIKLGAFTEYESRKNAIGIISMSYGGGYYKYSQHQLKPDSAYFDTFSKIKGQIGTGYESDNFSNLIIDENYKENRQLKILALGNAEDEYIDAPNINKPSIAKIYNLTASSDDEKKEIESQLFTDNYSSTIANIFENDLIIKNNNKNFYLDALDKNNNFHYSNIFSSNIFNSDKYTSFSNNLLGVSLGYSRKINDKFSVSFLGNYYHNRINFKNHSDFKINDYSILSTFKYSHNNLLVNNAIKLSKIDIFANRKVEKENLFNNLNSIKLDLELGYNFNLDKQNDLKLIGNLGIDNLFINENKVNSNLGITVLKNYIHKYKLGMDLNLKTKITDKLDLENEISSYLFLNEKTNLKVKIANVETTLIGKDLNKLYLNYSSNIKYKYNDNIKLNGKLNIDSNSKMQLNLGILYQF